MTVTRLLRVGRNVAALEPAAAFYADVLGFEANGAVHDDPALARLLQMERVRILRMRLGVQEIELSQCYPAGAPYPAEADANALSFQHIAILTRDIAAAFNRAERHRVVAISKGGPVQLPAAAGGVIAYKFRDPDGHPLEFLQFPEAAGKPVAGYDHSAISVSDVNSSVAFYARIGVVLESRQVNQGAEQDALDGLENVAVDVVALKPPSPAPHVELLCYRRPQAIARPYGPADLCADRLVFAAEEGKVSLRRDPDGHVILLDGR
jgi:catechol 2,3-dioxygenase-like lactoylglutathione lyase family enzyme